MAIFELLFDMGDGLFLDYEVFFRVGGGVIFLEVYGFVGKGRFRFLLRFF